MERQFETLLMSDLGVGHAYDLLTAAIAPRPVAFVTTRNKSGEPNLAPFSFFTLGGANPPSLVISAILNLDGSPKETYLNILDTDEFVVNTVHREMMEGLVLAAERASENGEKWLRAGFTELPGAIVKAPRLAESLVQLECRRFQIVEHGVGPGAGRYVIGEVLAAHVSRELLVDGRISGDLMQPIARMGGKSYVDTALLELFQ